MFVVFVSAAAVFVLAAPAAARAVAGFSGLAPIVAEHGLAAASVASVSAVPVFGLVAAVAEHAVAVAFDVGVAPNLIRLWCCFCVSPCLVSPW